MREREDIVSDLEIMSRQMGTEDNVVADLLLLTCEAVLGAWRETERLRVDVDDAVRKLS